MSDYLTETDPSRARRRRIRALVTILVIVLALFYAFWYAYSYIRDEKPSAVDTPATPTCQTIAPTTRGTGAATPDVARSKVRVNVYNATNRNGLAGGVAKELTSRGFVVAKVANDPLKKKITGVGELRHGADGAANAGLLALLTPGATDVVDTRKDATVDLVLGDAWKELGPEPTTATPTSTLPPCPS